MIQFSRISIQIALFTISLFVFCASIYFQYVEGLIPCPLCLMQRMTVFILMILVFTGIFIKKPTSITRLCTLQILISLAGVYFAARQLWLQHLPADQMMSCVPGLDVMLQYFPWQSVAKALFLGSGDCAETVWSFAGLSMAAWSLCWFLFMMLASIYMRFRYKR